jgi:hypothetical protein
MTINIGLIGEVIGKPEGRRLLGRQRRGWKDNIKMDLGELRSEDKERIHLPEDMVEWRALVNTVINFRIP